MITAVFYFALLVSLAFALVVRITQWHSTRPAACLERHFRKAFLEAVERGDYISANHYAGAWLARGTILKGGRRRVDGQLGGRFL